MVASGDSVTQNDWMWNMDGTYGIIGMNPFSPFWNGFTEASNGTAQYTISLAP